LHAQGATSSDAHPSAAPNRSYKGLAAIERWKAETKKKYQHTVEPLAAVQKGDKTIVTNRLTGNFPGSPIELQFIFALDGNKIASLEIHS
jgi:hypothetical protein